MGLKAKANALPIIYKNLHGLVFLISVVSSPISSFLIFSTLVIPASFFPPTEMTGTSQPHGLCSSCSLCLDYSPPYIYMANSPTVFRSSLKVTFSVRLLSPILSKTSPLPSFVLLSALIPIEYVLYFIFCLLSVLFTEMWDLWRQTVFLFCSLLNLQLLPLETW